MVDHKTQQLYLHVHVHIYINYNSIISTTDNSTISTTDKSTISTCDNKLKPLIVGCQSIAVTILSLLNFKSVNDWYSYWTIHVNIQKINYAVYIVHVHV